MDTEDNPDSDGTEAPRQRSLMRRRADEIKAFRCKNLIAVIEEPNDFSNIGSVVRNANALGIEAVYVIDPGKSLPSDWQMMRENRKLSSVSVSGVKWTFVKTFDTTDDCIAYLTKRNFVSVVTSPHVRGKVNQYLHEADYTKFAKLAVWFGNESRGISPLAVEHAKMCVSIPMFGMVESMNLGTSSGIVLYEITKQRRAYQSVYKKKNRSMPRVTPLPEVIPRTDDSAGTSPGRDKGKRSGAGD